METLHTETENKTKVDVAAVKKRILQALDQMGAIARLVDEKLPVIEALQTEFDHLRILCYEERRQVDMEAGRKGILRLEGEQKERWTDLHCIESGTAYLFVTLGNFREALQNARSFPPEYLSPLLKSNGITTTATEAQTP